MGRPQNQSVYSVANAISSIIAPVQEARDPTTLDVKYPLYQQWVNTSTLSLWILVGFTSTTGTVLATWLQQEGTTSEIQTITGDSGGAVSPTANNVNLLGASGQIVVTGSPSTSTLTISLAGGGTAIDSFQPDSGTNPVVPTAAGLVTMTGGNGIATVGGLNTLTFDMESPFTGDFTFQSTTSADTETLTVTNTSNTASSQTQILASVAGTTAGDVWQQFTVGTTRSYAVGIDNSDSQAFKLNTNNSGTVDPSSGTNIVKVTSAGVISFNGAYAFPTTDGAAGQVLTTNGSGTLSFQNSGIGTWTDTSGVFTAAVNTGYFLTAASTATLPAAPAQGNTVDIVCDTTGSCVITANAGQSIRISSQISSVAGTATNSARGDSLQLVYRSSGATWFAFASPNGAWTTA